MRKEILLPAIAVVGGGAGFALRRWELATAFEADTGLPISGAPATMALIALSVVVAAVLLILSFMGKYPRFSGYDQAFPPRIIPCMPWREYSPAFCLLARAA